jgi:[ribosomal protein S5]-alanine N-acetyltransferase
MWTRELVASGDELLSPLGGPAAEPAYTPEPPRAQRMTLDAGRAWPDRRTDAGRAWPDRRTDAGRAWPDRRTDAGRARPDRRRDSASELRLSSARLELRPCSPEACLASLQGPRALARLEGIDVPSTWPPRELTDALALYARGLDAGDCRRGWGIWLMISPEQARGGLGRTAEHLVGSAGFKGRPDAAGCVEIGYGVEPGWRRRGFATEAVGRLAQWAWEQGVRRIVAECDERNTASAGVLRATGMRLYDRRGRMHWWELQSPS